MSQPSVWVRPLREADVPTIASFNAAMAFETERLTLSLDVVTRGIQKLLADPSKGFYRVAETSAGLAGQIMVTSEWSDWRCGYWWWIQSVYVAPAFRRRGVFRQLYDEVAREAALRDDVRGFRLYVERENHVAQSTYKALGMQPGKYVVFESQTE